MLCYRDMTFCKFYMDCTGAKLCGRKLTTAVRQSAVSFGLPIMEYSDKPHCHKEIVKVSGVVVDEIKKLQAEIMSLRDKVEDLEEDNKFLECLRAAGVDNWSGYDVAQEMMDEQ